MNQDKYAWGAYDSALYEYYKQPAEVDTFAKALEETITSAEAEQRRIAPGIYAEYGYLLMQQGKKQEAIQFFQREKRQWPESARLMDQMVAVASGTNAKVSRAEKN